MDSIVSGKPSWIGHNLRINLTRDILGCSSTGYVIRIKCSDQDYALKRTHIMDEEPPDLARFEHPHPHVVDLKHYWVEGSDEEELRPLFEAGLNEGSAPCDERHLFLVMELMDGDLAQLMAEAKRAGVSPFSLPVAVDIMLQIARGMVYLHDEMSVSHPYLSCVNVLYRIVNRTDKAFLVGDVIVKLGGFGCSRPADMNSKRRDVWCFGLTCLEILTGDERPAFIREADMVSQSSIPETTPAILKNCIVRCLDMELTFSEIVTKLAELDNVLQTSKDDFMSASESIHTKIVQTKAEDSCAELPPTFISNDRLEKIFAVHQLHPQLGDVSTSVRATLIFFHGFHKVPEEWRRTWMTRDNKLVWPQTWLPEDLGAGNIRVLSVSFDANLSGNYNRFETGKDLVQRLVLSPRWKLGENEEKVFLVGHSFGGVIIKSLVTETRRFVSGEIRNSINLEGAMKCRTFLKSLATIVFYSVPHALMGQEFENYISECRNIFGLPRSSFLQSLWEDAQLIPDMNQLSEEFESAVSDEKMKVLAFLEGQPMSKNRVLFTEKSCESCSWEWYKIHKDNHFEVCRPDSKNHIGYKELKDHLQCHMNATRSELGENKFNVTMAFSLDDALISAAVPSKSKSLMNYFSKSGDHYNYFNDDSNTLSHLFNTVVGPSDFSCSALEDLSMEEEEWTHSQCLEYLEKNGISLIKNRKDALKNCRILLNMAANLVVLPPHNDPPPHDFSNLANWKASLCELIKELWTVEVGCHHSLARDYKVYVLTTAPYSAFLTALACEVAHPSEIRNEGSFCEPSMGEILTTSPYSAFLTALASKVAHPSEIRNEGSFCEPPMGKPLYDRVEMEFPLHSIPFVFGPIVFSPSNIY